MTVSDPIADLLTRIRNALKSEHRYVDIPASKLKESIAEILQKNGFIESYRVHQEKSGNTLRIHLRYGKQRKPIINGLKRISKPGCRRYVKANDIPLFFGGLGLSIISTSRGVIDGQDATKNKVGGEILCYVW